MQRGDVARIRPTENWSASRTGPARRSVSRVASPRARHAARALGQRPVGREVDVQQHGPGPPGLKLNPVRTHHAHRRGPLGEWGGAHHGVDAPVRRAHHQSQVRLPGLDERRLLAGREIERRVGQRDVADGVGVQPAPVARRGEVAAVEHRVLGAIELALPTTGQRDRGRDAVGLPVGVGEGDLDAEGVVAPARLGLEEVQQRLVVGDAGAGVAGERGDVGDGCLPADVQERRRAQRQQHGPPPPPQQRGQRCGQQRAQAVDVAADRGGDDEDRSRMASV